MPERLTPRGQAAPPVEPVVTGAQFPSKEEATKKKPQRKPKVSDSGVRYVRNLHHILTRVTLVTGREIKLEPRGQREDLDIVSADEQNDPKFLANKDLLFEVITTDDAKAIIYKQQTNARKRGTQLHDFLRNEKGEAYDPANVGGVQPHGGHAAITVGQIAPGSNTPHTTDNVEVQRSAGPHYAEVPGSPGHKATEYMQSVPGEISPEDYHEFLLWKQFKAERARQQGGS